MSQAAVDSEFERLVRAFLAEPVRQAPPIELGTTRHADGDGEASWWTSPVHAQASERVWVEDQREPSPHDWSASGPAAAETGALSPAVAAVQDAVAALAAEPASGKPADVAAVLAVTEQLRGLALRGIAEMDATGSHLATGAATAATWLRDTQVIGHTSAKAKVRLAKTLRDELPRIEQLLSDGSTTLEHVGAVVAGTRGLDPRIVADSQDALCELMKNVEPQIVREELRERAEAISPELGREAERRAHARRGFTADTVPNGVVFGGTAGVEDGQVFLLGLDLAVEADRTDGDSRSLRQRRLDVLVQWSGQAAAELGSPAGSVADDLRTARTHLLLTCTPEQLEAARRFLGGLGTPLARRGQRRQRRRRRRPLALGDGAHGLQLRIRRQPDPGRWLVRPRRPHQHGDAEPPGVRRIRQPGGGAGRTRGGENPLGLRPDPASRRRDPLYVGRAARIVTAAQWRALVLRDGRCVVKGCRRPPSHCQAHHVRHWLAGGRTDLDNLVLLCHQHHHEHHDRGHDLQHRDGRWLTSSGWRTHAPP